MLLGLACNRITWSNSNIKFVSSSSLPCIFFRDFWVDFWMIFVHRVLGSNCWRRFRANIRTHLNVRRAVMHVAVLRHQLIRPVWWIGQTGSHRDSSTSIQRTPAREGPRRGKSTLGCSRLGRPARASSSAMETKKEQHVKDWKS